MSWFKRKPTPAPPGPPFAQWDLFKAAAVHQAKALMPEGLRLYDLRGQESFYGMHDRDVYADYLRLFILRDDLPWRHAYVEIPYFSEHINPLIEAGIAEALAWERPDWETRNLEDIPIWERTPR